MKGTDVNSPALEHAGLLALALIGVACAAMLTPLMAQPSPKIPLLIICLIFAAIGGCTFAAPRHTRTANHISAALTGGSATFAIELDMWEGFALSIFALVYGAGMIGLMRLRHHGARSAAAATPEIKRLQVASTDLSNVAGRSPVELRGLPFDCLLAERQVDRRLTDASQQAQLDSFRTLQFLEDVILVVRPPLNTILGFAEILQSPAARDLAEDERRIYHQLMLDCSRQLSAFIADVGDMARIDANHFHLIEQEVDAAELTEIAMKSCGAVVEEADAVVIANVIENVELRCDAARVRRVLVSLVTRAAKAGRSGSSVNVSFVRRHDGGLDILVTDQGPVLSSDDIAQAFEPSLHEPGMEGLSLPIARRIALLHGGSLTMEPAPGGGMSACLSLPSNRVSWKSGDAFETPRAA